MKECETFLIRENFENGLHDIMQIIPQNPEKCVQVMMEYTSRCAADYKASGFDFFQCEYAFLKNVFDVAWKVIPLFVCYLQKREHLKSRPRRRFQGRTHWRNRVRKTPHRQPHSTHSQTTQDLSSSSTQAEANSLATQQEANSLATQEEANSLATQEPDSSAPQGKITSEGVPLHEVHLVDEDEDDIGSLDSESEIIFE